MSTSTSPCARKLPPARRSSAQPPAIHQGALTGASSSATASGESGSHGPRSSSAMRPSLPEATSVCLGGDGPCWDVDVADHEPIGGPASVTGSWDGATLTLSQDPTSDPHD